MQAIFAKHGVASRVLDLAISADGDHTRGVTRDDARRAFAQWSALASVPPPGCAPSRIHHSTATLSGLPKPMLRSRCKTERISTCWRTFRMRMRTKSSARVTAGASSPAASYDDWPVLEATPQRLRAAFQTARRLLVGQRRTGGHQCRRYHRRRLRHRFGVERAAPGRSRRLQRQRQLRFLDATRERVPACGARERAT